MWQRKLAAEESTRGLAPDAAGERVLVEINLAALERLLAQKSLKIEELRSVDRKGKQCIQQLFLELLKHQLAQGV